MSTTHSTKDFLLNQAQNTTTISEKISCYKKIIELDCDDPGAFHSLGNVYSAFDQGKSKMYWEMSVQKYEKKIESFKDSASKYLKQPDTAKSSEIDPKDVFQEIGQCFYSLGEVYDNLDEYFQASEAYKNALKMDSEKVYCLFDIAVSLYNDDKFKESKKYLQLAVRLMPGDPIVNDHYGDVLWKNGNEIQARYYWNYVLNLEKAEDELKKVIEEKLTKGL